MHARRKKRATGSQAGTGGEAFGLVLFALANVADAFREQAGDDGMKPGILANRSGDGWHRALADLLSAARFSQPDHLARHVNSVVDHLGLRMSIYLVDHEQQALHVLATDAAPAWQPLPIDSTLAGKAFRTVSTLDTGPGAAPRRLWVPLVDDTERLGVVEITVSEELADPVDLLARCETFVGLIGHLIANKLPYGDSLHQTRRTRTMSPAGELLLALLAPSTFTCERLVISALLEPAYDVGGDVYDYSVDADLARMFIADAMGRGLSAGLTSATAVSAIRSARRDGQDLHAMITAADTEIAEQFPDLRFATAVLAELDLDGGLLRYINAGHPHPILMRHGRAVKELSDGKRLPLGMGDTATTAGEETLEPGDRLLFYTDGVIEARDGHGTMFGLDRLIDHAERHALANLPAPETLRRLTHAVTEYQGGTHADDATLMLVEWSNAAARRAVPQADPPPQNSTAEPETGSSQDRAGF